MNQKRMDEKTRIVLAELFGYYNAFKHEKQELESELEGTNEKANLLFGKVMPWAGLYYLSMTAIAGVFFEVLGWGEKLRVASQAADKKDAVLEIVRAGFSDPLDLETQFRLDSLDDDEQGIFLALFFALVGNISSLQMYGESLSELIRKSDTDQESLLKAVRVDRSVVGHPNILRHISQAQIRGDEKFMNLLAKSVTQTKPRRKVELDDFRYMVEIVDEFAGLRSFTFSELAQLFTNDLGVYPEGRGGDAAENIKKYAHIREKRTGK